MLKEVAFPKEISFLGCQYYFHLYYLNNYLTVVIGAEAINSVINY